MTKIRFTIRELLLLPVIVLACLPIVTAAEMVGAFLLPQFTSNGTLIRTWFLDRGCSEEFVCRHLTFFVMQIPTILVLASLVLTMFSFRLRVLDIAAVVLLATFPVIDSLELGWRYFQTQPLAFATVGALIILYVVGRRQLPSTVPSRKRVWVACVFLAMVLVPSLFVWQRCG